jgi:hypothetical protein
VDEASESVTPYNRARATRRSRHRSPLIQPLVGSSDVVVVDELPQKVIEVTAPKDQLVVQ